MANKYGLALLAGAAAVTLTIGGCGAKSGSGASPADVQSALKTDEKNWNDQFKSKDLEGLLSHYADDAFFVAPGVPGASGSTQIRKAYSDALADNYFTISFASDRTDVAGSGDMAYTRGHFSEKYQDPTSKKLVSDSGTYITVYKKQADGGWKAVEDIAVADPATRKEEAATAATPAKKINLM